MNKDNKTLEYIANCITNGFTRGYYPHWELSLNNIRHDELDTGTLEHIASAVADGYAEGEIIESDTGNGWWKVQF